MTEQMKALKAFYKEQQMMEAVRHANEQARIAREYAEQLEALILGMSEPSIPEEVAAEIKEIEEIIPVEVPAELVAEVEPEVAVSTPEPEPKKDEPKVDLRNELIKFLMVTFVKAESNVNHTVPEFHELFMTFSGVEVGKNTFTKELNGLGVRHFKSNGTIKYKFNWADVSRVISPLWTEPEAEIIPVPEVKDEVDELLEQFPESDEEPNEENNLALWILNNAEEVERKSSKKNEKLSATV